jgi:hypothetical protein
LLQGSNWQKPVDTPPFFCYNELREELKMSIKLVLLKSGETIISDAKELLVENPETKEKVVQAYLLNKPHKVSVQRDLFLTEEIQDTGREIQVIFSSWIVLTNDENIVVPKDWVVTIVEPLKSVIEMYEEKVNG